jgi:hypothetical protein
MTSDLNDLRGWRDLVVDCGRPALLARFWATALGWDPPVWSAADLASLRQQGIDDPDDDPVVFITAADPALPRLCFQQVPEPKAGKNRLHLDVNVAGEPDVQRLVDAGARVLSRHDEDGQSWVVLADPEGNEFCAVLVG